MHHPLAFWGLTAKVGLYDDHCAAECGVPPPRSIESSWNAHNSFGLAIAAGAHPGNRVKSRNAGRHIMCVLICKPQIRLSVAQIGRSSEPLVI